MSFDLPETKEYSIRSLDDIKLEKFDCADDMLNNFFKQNACDNEEELISKTYFLVRKNDDAPVVAFCLSNAEIKAIAEIDMVISPDVQYENYPAVRIGRLATHNDFRGQGLGKLTMTLIKTWFVMANKTGCRFIIVDSRKTKEAEAFYNNNGFEDYPEQEENSRTVLKYFDLKPFKNSLQ